MELSTVLVKNKESTMLLKDILFCFFWHVYSYVAH